MNQKENIYKLFDVIKEYWSPKVIAEVNDEYVKIAKLKGSLVWHTHENEDELFYIIKGNLEIQLEDQTINLSEGDFYVVTKGIKHNPIAKEECWVMLVEKKETKHTGNTMTDKTKSIEEQLK